MDEDRIRLALPKGRMFDNAVKLMADAGLKVLGNGRNYRPQCVDDRFELKVLKPQNIVRMVEIGSHDVAFAGHDWVNEQGARVEELLDTGMDKVRVVAAVPRGMEDVGALKRRQIIVASEYENVTRRYLDASGFDYLFVRSYGATEVFPPEDADMIVDNAATGRTLVENGLVEIDTLLTSTTRLIANPRALEGGKGRRIEELTMLLRSVIDARARVMLEMNVSSASLGALLEVLPCMRRPTMSALSDSTGYAVKAAVPRDQVARLIPALKAAGATDILEYPFSKVVL
jgi:ATP phosphoribosyltransferase